MHETYKKMMDRQHLSSHAQADFLEKLDSAASPKRTLHKRILIAAVCLCLLIPCVALAAENIFDVAKVNLSEYPDASGELVPSFEIDFETTKEFPLEEIAEKWRYIEESQMVSYETWEEAQQDMGIELLKNTVLDSGKKTASPYNLYRSLDGQLYSISNYISYEVYGIGVYMDTDILVEHPTLPQEVKDIFTAVIFLGDDNDSFDDMKTEQYTSPSGLTATFIYDGLEDPLFVVFRANGVRYRIMVTSISSTDQYTVKELLIKVLDGFVVS